MAELTLIAEHPDFLVVHKPCGLNFHSEEGEAGFVALAQKQFDVKLFPVHRLDKVTSGLVLLPKSSQGAAHFTALFSERKINKYYLALCAGKAKKKQGWIKGDMAKSRRGAYKLLKTNDNPAITRFYSYAVTPGLRGVVLKPYSGKKHQLRVAMKSISAPILGDTLYGGATSDRVYLHAYALQFNYQGHNYSFCDSTIEGESRAHLFTLLESIEHQPWQLEW